jgi:hypothetical protein
MLFAAMHESAIGPKRTCLVAPHMSAFGGKADMALCGNALLRSLLGQSGHALRTSAFAPKRTFSRAPFRRPVWADTMGLVHHLGRALRRREFIKVIAASAAGWPLGANAQV